METHVSDFARLPALAALVMNRVAFTIDESAIVGACSRASLYRAIQHGRLRSIGSGSHRRILREDLERFLRSEHDPPR